MQRTIYHYLTKTIYISGTTIGRASDWYADIVKVPSIWNAFSIINQYKSSMFGMKASPYIGEVARKVDNVAPFGFFGDLTTTSIYKAAEKALKYNPDIKRAVGDSLGGVVALELQTHLPELKVRTYSAPVVDLKGAVQPTWNTNTDIYRNLGEPISMFDSSARTTTYPKIYDQTVLTHQYQDSAKRNRIIL